MDIDFQVKYGNRKTIALCINRDASILVYSPHWLALEKINEFVERKKEWIYGKLYQRADMVNNQSPYISGKSLMYLGKNYKLDLSDEDFEGVKFHNKFSVSRSNSSSIEDIIKDWYKDEAMKRVVERVHSYSQQMGASFNELKLSEAKYKWWSCTSKKNLIFNWKIIQLPLFVIDYIIVHELSHTFEMNHSAKFWNIVSVNYPWFEKAREWLKKNELYIL